MKRGVTLFELVVAMSLLFFTGSFVMNLFISGSRLPLRVEQGMRLEHLAQRQLDAILVKPFEIQPVDGERGSFPDEPGHSYRVKVVDFDADLFMVTVTAENSDGLSRSLRALRPKRRPVPPPPPPPPPPPDWDPDSGDPAPPPMPDFEGMGCVSCHGGAAPSAPPWTPEGLAESASNAGFGDDVRGYVRNSLEDPSAYQRPGYDYYDTNGDPWSGMTGAVDGISDDDRDAIADWLSNPDYPRPLPEG